MPTAASKPYTTQMQYHYYHSTTTGLYENTQTINI